METSISIIIPVYNTEKYIKTCLNSVIHQSYQDFEVILVDDGSTDKSGIICDAYKSKRIKVIHKRNGGLSDARNIGTDMAKGNYITWLDSDDTIHTDYLKELYDLIQEYSADMSVCELKVCREGENISYPSSQYERGGLTGAESLKRMLVGEIHGSSACGILLKSEIAKKHKFPFGKYHEDDLTTFQFYWEADKVAYTKRPLYNYLQRENSIMHKPYGEIDIAELDAADKLYDACSQYGKSFGTAAIVKRTRNYCDIAYKYANLKKQDKKTYSRIKKYFISHFYAIMKNAYLNPGEKIKILVYMLGLYKPAIKTKCFFTRLIHNMLL